MSAPEISSPDRAATNGVANKGQTPTDDPMVEADPEPFAAGNTNELLNIELPRQRRWPVLLLGSIIGAGATLGVLAFLNSGDDTSDEADQVQAELATAQVTVQDLAEEVEWIGDLAYGEVVEVSAASDATVTATVPSGTLVARGESVFELDNDPVPLFYGLFPFWRELREGDVGIDVALLKTNLMALGYDSGTTVTIDETFDAATTAMVARWQEDIGAEATGEFRLGSVVTAAGPSAITSAATVGERARSGGVLATITPRATSETVVAAVPEGLIDLAPIGEPVQQGTTLFTTAEHTVQAVTDPDEIAQLLLDSDTTTAELEAVLALGGHDPDGEMVIDSTVDAATEAAMMRWQESVGLTPTGDVDSNAYLQVPPELTVTEHLAIVDDSFFSNRPILVLSDQILSIVVPVGLADSDEFTVGQDVVVELPDESAVPAVVSEVGTVAITTETNQGGQADADPFIEVSLELTEAIDDNLPASEITVVVAGDGVVDAMVVPTRALVTLAEGGFAVEKITEDGATILIGVETGSFADGVVEVESSQLEPDDEVVVPQ